MDNKVIVALIPQSDDWCKIDPAHMTMVYVGESDNLKPSVFNELAKDVSSVAQLSNPVMAKVMGIEVFGDDEKVDVLRISSTPEILAIREMLEPWDKSEFQDFKPHATIGPAGTFIQNVPMYLVFDRIAILWGDTRIQFWLRKF